jgi:thioredoxin 1
VYGSAQEVNGKAKENGRMAEQGNTMTVTDDTFTQAIEGAGGLAMVDFWATWCGPCRIVAPIVEELARDYADKGVVVGKVDVDHNPGVAARFGVRSIPSILFFKDGKHVDTVVGAVPKAYLERKLQEHL